VPYHNAKSGDRLVSLGPNGGGYGDPLERDPAAVLSDMLDGYVSAEQAQAEYGVVIAAKSVDSAATARLRNQRSAFARS
jgi:N-methylhydantoinase B